MMEPIYKINGYVLELALGFFPSADRETADSFEKPPGTVPVKSYQWAEAAMQIAVNRPVVLKPREFLFKGVLLAESFDEYQAIKVALRTICYQGYVTLEAVHLGDKANATLKEDGFSWHRLTDLVSGKIAAEIEIRFAEVMIPMPYKDDTVVLFDVDANMDLSSTVGEGSIYTFSLSDRGELLMHTV